MWNFVMGFLIGQSLSTERDNHENKGWIPGFIILTVIGFLLWLFFKLDEVLTASVREEGFVHYLFLPYVIQEVIGIKSFASVLCTIVLYIIGTYVLFKSYKYQNTQQIGIVQYIGLKTLSLYIYFMFLYQLSMSTGFFEGGSMFLWVGFCICWVLIIRGIRSGKFLSWNIPFINNILVNMVGESQSKKVETPYTHITTAEPSQEESESSRGQRKVLLQNPSHTLIQ